MAQGFGWAAPRFFSLLVFLLRKLDGLLFFRLHPRFGVCASCVAPVRGGTYFLCRRKESKQRKRANTANASYCLRAPNGSHTSHGNALFLARCHRFESTYHPLQSPVAPRAAANSYGRPGGKLCVGWRALRVGDPTRDTAFAFQSGVERIWRESRHTVCHLENLGDLIACGATRAREAGDACIRTLAAGIKKCDAMNRTGPLGSRRQEQELAVLEPLTK